MKANRIFRFVSAIFAAVLMAAAAVGPARVPLASRVEISFAAAARCSPSPAASTSRSAGRTIGSTPIQQTGETGVPLFGVNVDNARAGATGDRSTRRRLAIRSRACATFPAGEYWVQPFVNVYTKFARADGHTVWLHMDQWEGQNWKRSPGNLYGDPVQDSRSIRHRRRRSSSSPTR